MIDPFREELRSLPPQVTWTPNPGGVLPGKRIVFAGMGGSALAAELAGTWLGRERPWSIVRDSRLPRWITPEDAVLCVSCSGNTRETLSVWREAGERGLPRGVVASGGVLLKSALDVKAPAVEIPSGLSPRSSLGYLLKGCLSVVPLASNPPWQDLAKHLEDLRIHLDSPGSETLQRALTRPLVVVAPGDLAVAAKRWVADFSENAKLPLWYWEFPEATHNAMMVIDPQSTSPQPEFFVLESSECRESEDWQEFMVLLGERSTHLNTVFVPHEDPWVESVGLAYVGDWTSVKAAEFLGVSAESISLMNEFKERLGRRLNS